MSSKTIFLTGATSGIGKAIAEEAAKKGHHLILCGRRQERLKELAEKLGSVTNVTTLQFDVRDKEKVLQLISELESPWNNIDVLINNAGNAHGLSTIQDGDTEDWDAMIDINVKGLLYVSKAILPGMVERKQGHVINIGSIAGKEVYPNGNVYCASKYAVDAINHGMRMDLNKSGIKVSAINPGMVKTEFAEIRFKGDKEKAEQAYIGYDPLLAKDIAEAVLFTIERPEHVNISDMIILPKDQASTTLFNKNLD